MDHDPNDHKEFRFSADGAFVAAGLWQRDHNAKAQVCVFRVLDGKLFDIADVTYDYGSRRLEINSDSRLLFSGAYHRTGIAAYDIETGEMVWERPDLRKLGELAYDPLECVLYCQLESRTVVLNASNGREHAYYRTLKDVFFGRDPRFAVFDLKEIELRNRATKATHLLERRTDILQVAFTNSAAVLSWVGGPVTAHDLATGREIWIYQPEGTHAYSIAPASDNESVWVAEQPYKEPPFQRVRRLSSAGEITAEVRCALGHSFALGPYTDSVVRGDLKLTRNESLGGS